MAGQAIDNQSYSGKIGVAGCGRMGGPMLAALLRNGFHARGFDIRPPSEFGALESHVTDDPEKFSHNLDTLITVVRDIPQTEDVLFEAQNFTATPSLRRVIICSTLSPRYVSDMAARLPGLSFIDAPMSGAQIAAEEARLSFMLGGEPADLDTCQPLFAAMGNHFHRMGGFGMGMQSKVLNNLLAASNTAMTRLVLEWAGQAGLDERALLDLIHTSSGQNWFASNFDDIEFSRDGLEPDNTIGILVKDVDSALDAAPGDTATDLPEAVRSAIAQLRPRSPSRQ